MLQKNRLNIQRYCTSSLFYLCSVYSLLNASIGFKFAAFTEGSSPNTTPITVENNTAITIDGTLIAVGEPVTFPTTFDSPIPVITPIIPPILVSTEASVRNCPRIVFLRAPIAFFRPISLVRYVTETNMIFMTPIPPTRREILAIQIS